MDGISIYASKFKVFSKTGINHWKKVALKKLSKAGVIRFDFLGL
jgi:hypothetical protein